VIVSASMNTGTAPTCTIGATVVGKPAATVITSSPGLSLRASGSLAEVRAEIATRLALEPELTSRLWRTPMKAANSLSMAAPSEPRVSQKSRVADTAASTSSSVKTRPA
jgi:hypothetical protein